MQEYLVDREKTERGQTKFQKKIASETQLSEQTASLSNFYVFVLFSFMVNYTINFLLFLNFCSLNSNIVIDSR